MALVLSRTFMVHKKSRLAMLPIIDCANHDTNPLASLKDAKSGISLIARRDIETDQEVTISYGIDGMSPAEAFSTYGFVSGGSVIHQALNHAVKVGQNLSKTR